MLQGMWNPRSRTLCDSFHSCGSISLRLVKRGVGFFMTLLFILLQVSITFSADVTNSCVPFQSLFSSQTNVQPDSVRWDFGNGTTATTPNAIATYSNVGRYYVTYHVFAHGNDYSMKVRNYITGKHCDCCNQNLKQ